VIEAVYDNAGRIILLRIDGVPYTPDALLEQLALARWAARRREADRQASQRYEERRRPQRNAQRAARKRTRQQQEGI